MIQIDVNTLSTSDLQNIYKAFTTLDLEESGVIDKDHLRKAFNLMNEKVPEEEFIKMMLILEFTTYNDINYDDFLKLIAFWRMRQQDDDSNELVDAFVEFGGHPDKSGCIDPEKLVRVIKEDFNLTFDIELFVQDLDTSSSGVIEFDEFVCIFANRFELLS